MVKLQFQPHTKSSNLVQHNNRSTKKKTALSFHLNGHTKELLPQIQKLEHFNTYTEVCDTIFFPSMSSVSCDSLSSAAAIIPQAKEREKKCFSLIDKVMQELTNYSWN